MHALAYFHIKNYKITFTIPAPNYNRDIPIDFFNIQYLKSAPDLPQ